MRLFISSCLLCCFCLLRAQQTEVQYLSGIDKDNTVMWDFYCSAGRNSETWSKIAVPSNWELQGFGHYNYGRSKTITDEQGFYRYEFKVPAAWQNKSVYIVFEGSMTETEVKINGQLAGAPHIGSFYKFKYDISSLLKYGSKNKLEVTVSKVSKNEDANKAERAADYWVFGGIFRPVYLEAYPKEHIAGIAVDAKADGHLSIHVKTEDLVKVYQLEAQVYTLEGATVGNPLFATVDNKDSVAVISGLINDVAAWSPEFPNLYKVKVSLKDIQGVKHEITQRFGFRTIEVRQSDGIYVNGKRIMFRGVNRHSFWPKSGRTTSKELSIVDVNLMKDMNMNAVRMSHYPPDQHFLDVCDSLGLFVLDELAGWHHAYDTETGKKLIKEMVERDVNHPSIVLWDNGNEGGFNKNFRTEFAKYDPQNRTVIEPWATLNGINTKHYIQYNYGINTFFNGRDIFFPTEFLHGLYDGGHGAGLDDYWNLMLSNPLSAGGFLWVFSDEGVVRRDIRDSIDCDGNNAPDGILGPYREKEGSFYAIKEIWSPVYFAPQIITPLFDGVLKIENRYTYTNLKQCKFSYELVKYSDAFPKMQTTRRTVQISSPNAEPGSRSSLDLKLPDNWAEYDVIQVKVADPFDRLLNTWSFPISSAKTMATRIVKTTNDSVKVAVVDSIIILNSAGVEASFNLSTGRLTKVMRGESLIPFNNGPITAGFESTPKAIKYYPSNEGYSLELVYEKNQSIKWTMLKGGWLRLDFEYKPGGQYDFLGLTFSYPEDQVTGATLMANGPYRVWKNRMKGGQFGVYHKKYNNTVTGESWDYPEFKGYYSKFYAVTIESEGLPFTMISATDDLFLHLFTPTKPKSDAGGTIAKFPIGNISFLHSISPIGTKFSAPDPMGPQSQKGIYSPNGNTEPLKGTVYFRFGE